MRARHLTLAAGIAAAALTIGGFAASLTTPAGRRDVVSIAVHALTPMGVPAPSLDAIYTAPLKFTSAAIDQLPFSFSLASG